MKRIEYSATGTEWIIVLFEDVATAEIKKRVLQYTHYFDNIFSRFNSDSILNSLNVNSTEELQKLLNNWNNTQPNILRQALEVGLKIHELTEDEFNIFSGKYLREKGYGSGNTNLDLGSFAKGLLVDKISEVLKIEFGLKYFLINAGGDILATSNHGEPVELYLEHPETGEINGKIKAVDTAMCSSSNHKRTWTLNGQKHQHIIRKNNIIKGVSSYHASCMVADLLATVIFVTGEKYLPELTAEFGQFRYNIS